MREREWRRAVFRWANLAMVLDKMDLDQQILAAIQEERYLVSVHAQRRLRGRGIELWQIEAGVDQWHLMEVRPDDLPNPSLVCRQELADGTEVIVVWAWRPDDKEALLVTVHFDDR